MKKILKTFSLISMILFISNLYANKIQNKNMRVLNVAGLIVDSKSLLPLENSKIFDEKGTLIAKTDAKGYFKGKVNCAKEGPISFTMRIEKNGYSSFTQKENWGDLHGTINNIYYFVIKKENDNDRSFSKLISNKKDISYDAVSLGFKDIVAQVSFQNTIESVKKGNDAVYFKIGDEYYLISNTGWLKLNSPNDNVSINGEKIVVASEINTILSRDIIKIMSTSDSKDYSFEVYIQNKLK